MTEYFHKVPYKRLVQRKLLGSEQKGELCVLSLNGQSENTKLFAYVMNSNLAVWGEVPEQSFPPPPYVLVLMNGTT
jgi:hypothetical protein